MSCPKTGLFFRLTFIQGVLQNEVIDNDNGIHASLSSMRKAFEPLKNGLIRDRVFETLRSAIFAGDLRPGDPLREMHLAKELQVSQAPVREALLQLEQCGLVVREANVGTRVTKLSNEELQERLRVRIVLEGLAAVEASSLMTKDDYRELNDRLEKISEAVAANAYFETARADLEFHRYVWRCSRNKTLYRTLDQLTAPLFAFVMLMRSSGLEDLRTVVRSHEPIVAALRRKNPEVICKAIRAHVESSYGQFLTSGVQDIHALAEALR
ncbi:MAG: GntR family transcriptional regulator [Acidobacteria bacterium]|nr:GntR family transcriptional regulator [Acidobacteriota bacterium]MCI0719302.1 GntR family transcriptional regulator [Acidobacteriota bacterium]